MKLSFSTVGCPNFTWDEIISTAKDFGYDGIEIRGLQDELKVYNANPFLIENIQNTISRLMRLNLSISCISTSCYIFDKDLYQKTIDEAKQYMLLANRLKCRYLRVLADEWINPSGKVDEEFVFVMLKELCQLADDFDVDVLIDTTQIYRTSKLVSSLTGVFVQPNKAIVGANAFAHESGIHQHGVLSERTTYEIIDPVSIGLPKNRMVLGKHSGRHAFEERLKELGYTDLTREEIDAAFEKFKVLADKKKVVLDKDIEALLEQKSLNIPETYELVRFQIISGNGLISTASVRIKSGEEEFEEAATGDGPVDAIFKAIDRITGLQVELDDYSIKAVTQGKDALGEVTVRNKKEGKGFLGRVLSTDILEASAKAYVNAINKMLYKISEE